MHLCSILLLCTGSLVHVSCTPLPLLTCFGLCSNTPPLAEAANGLGRGAQASIPSRKVATSASLFVKPPAAPMLATRPDLSRNAMNMEAMSAKSLQGKPTDLEPAMSLTAPVGGKPDLKRPGMDLKKIALGKQAQQA